MIYMVEFFSLDLFEEILLRAGEMQYLGMKMMPIYQQWSSKYKVYAQAMLADTKTSSLDRLLTRRCLARVKSMDTKSTRFYNELIKDLEKNKVVFEEIYKKREAASKETVKEWRNEEGGRNEGREREWWNHQTLLACLLEMSLNWEQLLSFYYKDTCFLEENRIQFDKDACVVSWNYHTFWIEWWNWNGKEDK